MMALSLPRSVVISRTSETLVPRPSRVTVRSASSFSSGQMFLSQVINEGEREREREEGPIDVCMLLYIRSTYSFLPSFLLAVSVYVCGWLQYNDDNGGRQTMMTAQNFPIRLCVVDIPSPRQRTMMEEMKKNVTAWLGT